MIWVFTHKYKKGQQQGVLGKESLQMATRLLVWGEFLKVRKAEWNYLTTFLILLKNRGHGCGCQLPDAIRYAFTFQIWLESRIQSLEYWEPLLETCFPPITDKAYWVKEWITMITYNSLTHQLLQEKYLYNISWNSAISLAK